VDNSLRETRTTRQCAEIVSLEPKIGANEAIAIATTYARSKGVATFGCFGSTHASDAMFTKEFGYSNGHGFYMIALNGDKISDTRHYETGEELLEIAITVQVNDQTGEAEQFHRL
jgi:hypothetical protein